jgi:hypothetical protein
MPSYNYEVQDQETAEVLANIVLVRPVAKRDSVALKRSAHPDNLVVSTGSGPDIGGMGDVLKRAESRYGTTELERRTGFSSKTLKKVHGL